MRAKQGMTRWREIHQGGLIENWAVPMVLSAAPTDHAVSAGDAESDLPKCPGRLGWARGDNLIGKAPLWHRLKQEPPDARQIARARLARCVLGRPPIRQKNRRIWLDDITGSGPGDDVDTAGNARMFPGSPAPRSADTLGANRRETRGNIQAQ